MNQKIKELLWQLFFCLYLEYPNRLWHFSVNRNSAQRYIILIFCDK